MCWNDSYADSDSLDSKVRDEKKIEIEISILEVDLKIWNQSQWCSLNAHFEKVEIDIVSFEIGILELEIEIVLTALRTPCERRPTTVGWVFSGKMVRY